MRRVALFACLLVFGSTAVKAGAPAGSGWIPFVHYTNLGIYFPVTINGHQVEAQLWGGPTVIDKTFARTIALPAGSVSLELGTLPVANVNIKEDDFTPSLGRMLFGRPLVARIGENIFERFAVDVDFANQRLAFLPVDAVVPPPDAVEVPLVLQDGERVVPASVNGASAEFELELGNVIGPLLVTPAFANGQKLLVGHPQSQRISGPFIETTVSADRLAFAGVDFPRTPIAIIPDSQLPPSAITGGIGLPLLEKFHLLIDYSHSRLFAQPYRDAPPIAKDRLGLAIRLKNDRWVVAFVSPNSPAALAGFKSGEGISRIDGEPLAQWPIAEIIGLSMTPPGTKHVFTMLDGTTRTVTAADFF